MQSSGGSLKELHAHVFKALTSCAFAVQCLEEDQLPQGALVSATSFTCTKEWQVWTAAIPC